MAPPRAQAAIACPSGRRSNCLLSLSFGTPSLAKRMGDMGSREYSSICADTATYQELAEGSRQSFALLHPPSEKVRVGCYERRL